MDNLYGLKAETIHKIKTVFAQYSQVDRVILYGSRAKGNFKAGSDIDLTIQGVNLTHSDLSAIENQLEELLLPYKIDLSFYGNIDNAELLDHIQRCGHVFYSKG